MQRIIDNEGVPAAELLSMRGAAGTNDAALHRLLTMLSEGVTERFLAEEIDGFYAKAKAEGYFARIAFGKNTAEPYHIPDDTPLQEGDMVVFNVGCVVSGCLSTAARTLFWKRIGDKQRQDVFSAVLNVVKEAFAASDLDTPAADIEARMRAVAEAAGYGEYYQVGEAFPQEEGYLIPHALGDLASTALEVGTYYAMAPGIYIPGEFGVCIGDTVVAIESGIEVLSRFPREMEVL